MKRLTKFNKFLSNCNNKIWILYREETQINVLFDHPKMITCSITQNNLKKPIIVSFVYAKSTNALRKDLWNAILEFDLGNFPWALAEDFNATLSSGERNSALNDGRGACRDFQECIIKKYLFDLGFN